MTQRYWFTSDTHFGHGNIITYSKRPFKTVEEMDEELINRWNERVGKGDLIFHLGDFLFKGGRERMEEILSRLNGQIHLVKGNHDRDVDRYKNKFVWIKDLAEVKVPDDEAEEGKQRIILCHYAMRVWKNSHHGSWHLYGHSHGSLREDMNSRSFDIGVDMNGYAPVSYEEVKERMRGKRWEAIDHHLGERD